MLSTQRRHAQARVAPIGLAGAIERRRVELGLTQQELAEQSGLTRRTVSRGETGFALSESTRLALEKALKITLPGQPTEASIRPRAAAVGAFLRKIRRETTREMFPESIKGKWLTLTMAAESLQISTAQLHRLEHGSAAPSGLFEVGQPEGDICLMKATAWRSDFYMPHLEEIGDLASADGRKGRFRN
jgi:transcriptional regulator with XRE-family HTH domain